MMYLINAIYFKGSWTYQFEESETIAEIFHNQDGTEPLVPLMSYRNNVPYVSTNGISLIDLPYGDSLYSMSIALPNDPDALDEIAADLNPSTWDAWIAGLESTEVDVFMPKFELAYEKSLGAILSNMGMEEAFQPQVADFSRINPDVSDLHISMVLHKSFVEVNEEGTEAAAVTSVTVGTTSVDPTDRPVQFRVDRPFLFAIREQSTGSIIFIGQVQNL